MQLLEMTPARDRTEQRSPLPDKRNIFAFRRDGLSLMQLIMHLTGDRIDGQKFFVNQHTYRLPTQKKSFALGTNNAVNEKLGVPTASLSLWKRKWAEGDRSMLNYKTLINMAAFFNQVEPAIRHPFNGDAIRFPDVRLEDAFIPGWMQLFIMGYDDLNIEEHLKDIYILPMSSANTVQIPQAIAGQVDEETLQRAIALALPIALQQLQQSGGISPLTPTDSRQNIDSPAEGVSMNFDDFTEMVQADYERSQSHTIDQYADHLIKQRSVTVKAPERRSLIQGLKALLEDDKLPEGKAYDVTMLFIAEFVPKLEAPEETYGGDVEQLEIDFGLD